MAAGTKVQLRLGDRVVAEIAFHNGELRLGEHVLTISVGDGEDALTSRTGESEVWETARACFAPELPELAPRTRAVSTADSRELPFAAGAGPVAEAAEEYAASAAPPSFHTGESDVWETARACFAPELPEAAPRSHAASASDRREIPFAAGAGAVAEGADERAASAAPLASRTGESDVWETARACFAPELPELAPRSRAASAADRRELPFAAGAGPVAEATDERAAGAAPVGAAPHAGRRPAISLDLPDPEGRFAIEAEDLVGGQRPDAASIQPRFSESARAHVRRQEPPPQAAELADPLYAALIVARAGKVERVVSFNGAELVVGSGPTCDLVLSTEGISRHHALFVHEAGSVRVLDLDSAHGLRVNGERATERVLQFGDVVAIEDYALGLVLDREPLGHAVRSGAAASSVGSAGQLTARHGAPSVSMPERDLVTESDDEDHFWDLEKELEIVSGQATTATGSPSRSAGTGLAVEVVLGDEDLPPALRAALRELGTQALHLPAELRIRRQS